MTMGRSRKQPTKEDIFAQKVGQGDDEDQHVYLRTRSDTTGQQHTHGLGAVLERYDDLGTVVPEYQLY